MNTLYIKLLKNNIISITFKEYQQEMILQMYALANAKWNSEKKYWELPYSKNGLNIIIKTFSSIIEIDKKCIEKYLYKENQINQKKENQKYFGFFEQLKKELIIQKYRRNTIKSYIKSNVELLKYCKKTPMEIQEKDLKDYLYHLSFVKNFKSSTLDVIINGLKFYYSVILNKKFAFEITRPKKDKYLPTVLNKTEIKNIINSIDNIKHKTMIMLIYSAGLRVSEASKMRVQDIDFERETITVKNSKNRKDRITILSQTFAQILKKYLELYNPNYWLFEGQNKKNHITIRTIQKVFEIAMKNANIKKETGVHGLRHSFATNLLEEGTDIRYIQDLLGHASPKTTMIYTHVCSKKLKNIKSPLDTINFDD